MSNEETRERREYLRRAIEHAQKRPDEHRENHPGDVAGAHDISKQIGHLWNAYAAADDGLRC
jgi:hypothetical protein